jgi:Big-like domain-containing protein
VARISLSTFQISLLIVAGFALFLSTIVISYQQVPPTTTQSTQPTIKITMPKSGESVPTSGNLTIMGTSSDTGTSLCQVSVIVNDVKPYQTAAATGNGGASDYSQWKFTITPNYTAIKEGQNKITSKVECPGGGVGLTKWFGINVTGFTGAAVINANSTSGTVTGTGSQTSNASNQSSGPLYSYSQKQAESKKASESGQTQEKVAQKDLQQGQSEQSQSTVTVAPPNNETGSSTGFVPPFSP